MALLSSLMCICRGFLVCGALAAFLWGGSDDEARDGGSVDVRGEGADEWHIV